MELRNADHFETPPLQPEPGGRVGGAWPYHKAKVQRGNHGTWAYKVALGQSDPLVVAGRILKTEITRDRPRHRPFSEVTIGFLVKFLV